MTKFFGDEIRRNPIDGTYDGIQLLDKNDNDTIYDINRPEENIQRQLEKIQEIKNILEKKNILSEGVFPFSLTHSFNISSLDIERVNLNGNSKTYVKLRSGIAYYNNTVYVNTPNVRLAEKQLQELLSINKNNGDKVLIKYNETNDTFKCKIGTTEYGGAFDDDEIIGVSSIALLTAIYNDSNYTAILNTALGTSIEKILLEPIFEITTNDTYYFNINNDTFEMNTVDTGFFLGSFVIDDYTVPTVSTIDNERTLLDSKNKSSEWYSLNSSYNEYEFKVGEPISLIDGEAVPSSKFTFDTAEFIGLFIKKKNNNILVHLEGKIENIDASLFPYDINNSIEDNERIFLNYSGNLLLNKMPNNEDYYEIGSYQASFNTERKKSEKFETTYGNFLGLVEEYFRINNVNYFITRDSGPNTTNLFRIIDNTLENKSFNSENFKILSYDEIESIPEKTQMYYYDNTIYILLKGYGSLHVFKSLDDGVTWEEVIIPETFNENLLILDNIWIAAEYDSGSNILINKSIDSGETWTEVLNLYSPDASNPSTVDYILEHNGIINLFLNRKFIFRSDDDGDTWTSQSYDSSGSINSILQNGNTILLKNSGFSSAEVFISLDNGENWTEINSILSLSISGDTFNNDNAIDENTIIIFKDNVNYVMSIDNGENWTNNTVSGASFDSGNEVNLIKKINDDIIVILDNDIYVSSDNGINWTIYNTSISETPKNLIYLYDRYYLFTDSSSKLYYFFDYTFDFQNVIEKHTIKPLRNYRKEIGYFYQDNVYFNNGNTLIIPSEYNDGELFTTNDNGKTFNKVENYPGGYPSGGDFFVRINDDYFLYTNGDDIIKGSSDLETWNVVATDINPTKIARNTNNGNLLVSTDNDDIYISTDEGETWTLSGTPSLGFFVYIINIFYLNGKFLVISSQDEIFESTDDGVTWTSITNESFILPSFFLYDNALYALEALSTDIYRTTDGITWTIVNSTDASGRHGIFKLDDNNLYNFHFNTDTKILYTYRSVDNGLTWSRQGFELNYYKGSVEIATHTNKDLFVITRDTSEKKSYLYRSIDKGENWYEFEIEYGETYGSIYFNNHFYLTRLYGDNRLFFDAPKETKISINTVNVILTDSIKKEKNSNIEWVEMSTDVLNSSILEGTYETSSIKYGTPFSIENNEAIYSSITENKNVLGLFINKYNNLALLLKSGFINLDNDSETNITSSNYTNKKIYLGDGTLSFNPPEILDTDIISIGRIIEMNGTDNGDGTVTYTAEAEISIEDLSPKEGDVIHDGVLQYFDGNSWQNV
ncbi:MAG: WD40/YVTN/BNR-like repeat-containing protein [bacterium]